jgi:hypothetical protein
MGGHIFKVPTMYIDVGAAGFLPEYMLDPVSEIER